ncbi:MAG: AAA family ATPase [Microcoleus sp. PH2017_10_PVI_O_A]|uniref:bifunctional aminoglycoside phosphotransferase/ATP-binding protein n=1 Tax=unclassified Microcoleus TaxID=2642155 RepID=UPI001D28A9B5|nr:MULTISPECIES: bifunctional aminoglycoside phosphotransferase/ATP-binding protein [unclassified Microcoleus]TAE80874.1 MAG: adenylyl-sulfate kinase [Oscillatoriales cyanobacterium]MCC3407369.1 AAA family ATPase [Microcoleus sp. PH2017_10_PVI_O_A]MCC3461425.1 AAA family ATPase [Microcoleus sp. PH2017_11_PCY_U_A]MCC3479900.1 AAA family ATPase [Microcoleus sp. PH2017_12_PCY_D_A]MCC3531704.1 AAA family ATPase [Microcoleus sp. PH2017_21_RUC_O_A]
MTCLPALIQQMLQPGFYPHSVTEPVQLIQTHISFVLLTGDYTYKIKKPVNFGFLDYSTLEKRQHFCIQELEMNRRTAPEIYLEVLPIAQTGDSFQLGSNSPEMTPADFVVEYALKMREFPQDSLLLSLLERGLLTEQIMADLGREVAKFHCTAVSNSYIRTFGEVSQIRTAIDNNYRISQKYIGGPQTETQYQETKDYSDAFFEDNQDLFEQRIANNKIRECHGDLHLRNIALWQDKILLFDCIEFNEPFRFVDVMYDIAFAVMDLESRGRRDLGNVFLNTYVEQTGDWEGLQVLPLYLSRQAYVRGKVTSLMLDDAAVSTDEKVQISQTAAHYYKLAWEYTKPRQGKLTLMSGLSGSGKSTAARYLARRTGRIHIRSDAVRKHLGGIPVHERGGQDLYSDEMTARTYGRLLELGIMLAQQGWDVILDAKFDRQNWRTDAINLAQTRGLPLQIVYCTAPMAVLRERLQQRTGDIADATAELLNSQQAEEEPFTELEQIYVNVVNTAQDLEVQLNLICGK